MDGEVGYIVAPDIEHHIFVSEWARQYPSAKLVGPEGLAEKRAKQRGDPKIGPETFDVVFSKENKRALRIGADFDADFDYEYVDGHANLELVFLYKPDRVLIEADLMFNLPATEQYSRAPEEDRKAAGLADAMFEGLQEHRRRRQVDAALQLVPGRARPRQPQRQHQAHRLVGLCHSYPLPRRRARGRRQGRFSKGLQVAPGSGRVGRTALLREEAGGGSFRVAEIHRDANHVKKTNGVWLEHVEALTGLQDGWREPPAMESCTKVKVPSG